MVYDIKSLLYMYIIMTKLQPIFLILSIYHTNIAIPKNMLALVLKFDFDKIIFTILYW